MPFCDIYATVHLLMDSVRGFGGVRTCLIELRLRHTRDLNSDRAVEFWFSLAGLTAGDGN